MRSEQTASNAFEALRNLHIGSNRDAEAASHIERLLQRDAEGQAMPAARRFTKTGETRGFLLIGSPGSGKSHLVNRTLAKMPALVDNGFGQPRYIQCSVPSPATFKSMTLALLEQTGYSEANPRKEAWSLWQTFRNRLHRLEISVVWIDEAHDLFCADRKLILRAVKSLMQGENACVVILSGTEELADVIRTDPQVQRRFSAMVLPALVEQVDGEAFADIIEGYCSRVGVAPPVEADLIGRLFHAGRYQFGRALELFLLALEGATDKRAARLTIDDFAAAWTMLEARPASENVFLADKYWTLDLDGDACDGALPRRTERKRQRA